MDRPPRLSFEQRLTMRWSWLDRPGPKKLSEYSKYVTVDESSRGLWGL